MNQFRWLRSWLPLLASTCPLIAACSGDSTGGAAATPLGADQAASGAAGSPAPLATAGATAAPPETGGAGAGAPPAAPPAPPSKPGTSLPYSVPESASPALEARTWKLSHAQYQMSIEALLGVRITLDGASGPRLAPETSNGVFLNLSDSGFVSISNGLAEDYMAIAGEVSESASAEQLATLGNCPELASCPRDSFLETALTKAFRRPATDDDLALFGELFDAALAEVDVVGDTALPYKTALKGMLTSPYFLYRTEIGEDPEQVEFQLTSYEVASFLSYSLLGTPPSQELLELTSATGSIDQATLREQVEALLDEPAAESQFAHFMAEWLEVEAFLDPDFGLGRDGVKHAEGFDDVKQMMQQETDAFLEQNGTLHGSLTALLTAPVHDESQALSEFYHSEPTSDGAPPERVGIFGLGAGLSVRAKDASTSPTLRGLFVRERLMCQHFTIPPGVNPDLTDLKEQSQPNTTRELYELHALDPECSGCHRLFDPIGFTLETFDEAGRFRSSQSGVAIDTNATLIASDVDQEMNNHVDLANALAESTWVRECLARQAFRYYFGTTSSLRLDATGTRLEEERGLPPIQHGRAALQGTGDLHALVTAVLSSDSTLWRTRREPEQL